MWLQALGAMAGAGISYFGEQDAARKKRDALNKAKKQIQDTVYNPGEQRNVLDSVKDAYDTNIASETNNAAFGLSGVLNSNSARALTTSKMLGQRASSELQAKQQMTDYNKKMGLEIANLEAGTDTSMDFGNILAGGFAGANIGDSMDKMTTPKPEPITKSVTFGPPLVQSSVPSLLSPKLNLGVNAESKPIDYFLEDPLKLKKQKPFALPKLNMFGR